MRLLDYKALGGRGITYTRIHLRRLCKAGLFPAPIPISPNRVAWLESEIDDWIKSRIAHRPNFARCAGVTSEAM